MYIKLVVFIFGVVFKFCNLARFPLRTIHKIFDKASPICLNATRKVNRDVSLRLVDMNLI